MAKTASITVAVSGESDATLALYPEGSATPVASHDALATTESPDYTYTATVTAAPDTYDARLWASDGVPLGYGKVTIGAADGNYVVLAQLTGTIAAANVPVGQASDMPDHLVQGDAYTVANGREIRMYLQDADGNILSSFGTKSPADLDFTWTLRFRPALVLATSAEITGDYNDWITDDPQNPYLRIELPSAKTDLLEVPLKAVARDFAWQLIFQWGGDDSHELSAVFGGEIPVAPKLAAAA